MLAIGVAIAVGGRAWDQFSSSDVQFPSRPRAALRRSLRRRPQRLLAGRDRRLRRKAAARPRRRHLPVLLGRSCRSIDAAGPRRALALPGGLRRARRDRRAARPRPCRGAPLDRLRRLARRPRRAARAARGRCSRRCVAFAVGAGFDWFWQIAGLGVDLLPRSPGSRSPRAAPSMAAGRRPLREPEERTALRPRRSADLAWPGSRRWRWSGRCWSNTRSTASQNAAAARRPAERRRPRRTGPLDRALGRLALRPARPARRAAGRIRDSRDRPLHDRRSTARTTTGSGTTCAPRSSAKPAQTAAAEADLEKARELNPARCLSEGPGTAGEPAGAADRAPEARRRAAAASGRPA